MSRMLVAASEMELEGIQTNIPKVVLGVGKVQSTARAMKAIGQMRPSEVIMVGYAGAVADGLAIGDAFQAETVLQYDIDLTRFKLKRCVVPSGDGTSSLGELTLQKDNLLPLPWGRFGTADLFLLRPYLESHPFLKDELSLTCADMESYGLAYACVLYGIPCRILRVISDDSKGHRPKDFVRFRQDASVLFSSLLSKIPE